VPIDDQITIPVEDHLEYLDVECDLLRRSWENGTHARTVAIVAAMRQRLDVIGTQVERRPGATVRRGTAL
jgi:hypothetical protein